MIITVMLLSVLVIVLHIKLFYAAIVLSEIWKYFSHDPRMIKIYAEIDKQLYINFFYISIIY
jgi:hypothetical protein